MQQYLWLIPLGFGIGAYGTLIGAGGGFVLAPVLLILYPNENPEIIASISLAVVFFNALSGSLAYGWAKRIDYRSGLLFSIATVPGAVIGALTTSYIPRRWFDGVFGVLLIGAAVFLLLRPRAKGKKEAAIPGRYLTRTLVEADGTRHIYSYSPPLGVGISFFVGYISSLLGIGGGGIHVAVLAHLLDFPVHIATATSHFILAIMAFTGTLVHILTGTFSHGVRRTAALAIGVVIGAPLGAYLSQRVHGEWIIRSLALAIGFIGVRVLILAFGF